jgi:NAD+ kinase
MKVAIYGQYYKPEDKEYLKELFLLLEKNSIEYIIENHYYTGLKKEIDLKNVVTFSSHKDLNESFNFMITIGGDGTILRAVTYIRNSNIPIVGINTGRLGFLATVQKDEINNAIEQLLSKNYKINERSLFSVTTKPPIISL